jgi:hypothetical protein
VQRERDLDRQLVPRLLGRRDRRGEPRDPGQIVEAGPTEVIFNDPSDPRTNDYVNGRFG